MFLKRIILSSVMATCIGQAAMAISAYPHPIVVKQADGTAITVTLYGDENGHIALADDGQPLCFNGATGNYEYAMLKNGVIVASGVKAENAVERSQQAVAFIKSQDRSGILSAFQHQRQLAIEQVAQARSARAKAMGASRAAVNNTDMRINNFPTQGVQHSLVILAQFSDCPFTTVGDNPLQYYRDMLNKEGFTYSNGANGSARDFYVASSNGKFLPTFDVVGPIVLPKSYAYYGENVSSRDNAERYMEFVKEACTLADPLVDFSQYDHDGDGLVDNVFIYYAGYGEADSGRGNTIWPHASDYRDVCKDANNSDSKLVLDGVQIASYTCSNEINGQSQYAQPAGIGTFVHEFGHVLGLADHYDSQASSVGEAFHPRYYDTMASGSYNNNGNTPPTFSAFERASLGWLEYEELNASSKELNVLPNLAESNKAYRVSVNGTQGKEFFVLENRQQTGWDKYLPGHGMLMWHIDYDPDAWKNNAVNINNAHQRVDIVEADGIRSTSTTDGDTFPGAANVTSWKMNSWGDETVMTLDDIEEKNGIINIMLGGLDLKLDTPAPKVSEVSENGATVTWDAVNIAKQYVMNLYRVDGSKKTAVSAYTNKIYTDPAQVVLEGLQPKTSYQLTMKVQRGSYVSDEASVNFQTTAIPFAKLAPANLKASDASADAFTASWDAVEGADDYEVTLGRLTYADDTTERGYDFTDQLSGMPELWETNAGFMSNPHGAAAPSLRMVRDGAYLKVAYADAQISGVQFWASASNTAAGNIQVQVWKDNAWQTVQTLSVDADLKAGKTYAYNFDATDQVRLYVERTAGTFYIDDVVADCHIEKAIPLAAYDAVSSNGKTTFSFANLGKEGSKMVLEVVAKKGSERSQVSKLLVNLDGTTGLELPSTADTDAPAAYYDMNGRRISPAQMGHGVYIVKRGNKTYKIVR